MPGRFVFPRIPAFGVQGLGLRVWKLGSLQTKHYQSVFMTWFIDFFPARVLKCVENFELVGG